MRTEQAVAGPEGRAATLASPFLTFTESEEYFVFDGSSGVMSRIGELVYDILNLSPIYDIYGEEDLVKLRELLTPKYAEAEIDEAVGAIQDFNRQGFLEHKHKIYELFDEKYESAQNGYFGGCLWLNLSHDCNLRCTYCFGNGGDYGHSRMLMTRETAKACIDYWYAHLNRDQKLFDVAFFGGEPLMNQEVLFFAVEYINQLMSGHSGRVRYNITTNGTILNDKLLRLFKDNDFLVSISIDGIEKIHNRNRPFASGRGSFGRILQNIAELKREFSPLSSQITVRKRDIPFLTPSVEMLWEAGVNRVHSNLVFHEDEIYEYEDFAEYEQQIGRLAAMTFANIMDDKPYTYHGLVRLAGRIHKKKFSDSCFLWQNGAFIFTPEGDAYRCYRYIGNPEYKLGSIQDSGLALLDNRFKKERVSKCSACWAQLYCGDGCAYENEIYTGDPEVPAEAWCAKTKIMLKQSLKFYARMQVECPEKAKQYFNWS
ncbi:4Fe-4S cluster-binding domain-containing protein [Paenibacillus sp. alder61]|uniref:radical SAM/SPASM domain-containing protein n=1 Tax=Paenibacillus sp. alder61 TaxID=2862948 RepID=UPI001CD351C9|nr:radical SAM protein [Paenibacillus sp. alder61]MCA1292285.1 4Fe-4S cluster-binding domain-containing protein [Paenibacillus sp. alder61]